MFENIRNVICGISVFGPNGVGNQWEIIRFDPDVAGAKFGCVIICADPSRYRVGHQCGKGEFIPAATVSGISWENGGLDDVVESCVIISVFIF